MLIQHDGTALGPFPTLAEYIKRFKTLTTKLKIWLYNIVINFINTSTQLHRIKVLIKNIFREKTGDIGEFWICKKEGFVTIFRNIT
jgi:hypothetical protein